MRSTSEPKAVLLGAKPRVLDVVGNASFGMWLGWMTNPDMITKVVATSWWMAAMLKRSRFRLCFNVDEETNKKQPVLKMDPADKEEAVGRLNHYFREHMGRLNVTERRGCGGVTVETFFEQYNLWRRLYQLVHSKLKVPDVAMSYFLMTAFKGCSWRTLKKVVCAESYFDERSGLKEKVYEAVVAKPQVEGRRGSRYVLRSRNEHGATAESSGTVVVTLQQMQVDVDLTEAGEPPVMEDVELEFGKKFVELLEAVQEAAAKLLMERKTGVAADDDDDDQEQVEMEQSEDEEESEDVGSDDECEQELDDDQEDEQVEMEESEEEKPSEEELSQERSDDESEEELEEGDDDEEDGGGKRRKLSEEDSVDEGSQSTEMQWEQKSAGGGLDDADEDGERQPLEPMVGESDDDVEMDQEAGVDDAERRAREETHAARPATGRGVMASMLAAVVGFVGGGRRAATAEVSEEAEARCGNKGGGCDSIDEGMEEEKKMPAKAEAVADKGNGGRRGVVVETVNEEEEEEVDEDEQEHDDVEGVVAPDEDAAAGNANCVEAEKTDWKKLERELGERYKGNRGRLFRDTYTYKRPAGVGDNNWLVIKTLDGSGIVIHYVFACMGSCGIYVAKDLRTRLHCTLPQKDVNKIFWSEMAKSSDERAAMVFVPKRGYSDDNFTMFDQDTPEFRRLAGNLHLDVDEVTQMLVDAYDQRQEELAEAATRKQEKLRKKSGGNNKKRRRLATRKKLQKKSVLPIATNADVLRGNSRFDMGFTGVSHTERKKIRGTVPKPQMKTLNQAGKDFCVLVGDVLNVCQRAWDEHTKDSLKYQNPVRDAEFGRKLAEVFESELGRSAEFMSAIISPLWGDAGRQEYHLKEHRDVMNDNRKGYGASFALFYEIELGGRLWRVALTFHTRNAIGNAVYRENVIVRELVDRIIADEKKYLEGVFGADKAGSLDGMKRCFEDFCWNEAEFEERQVQKDVPLKLRWHRQHPYPDRNSFLSAHVFVHQKISRAMELDQKEKEALLYLIVLVGCCPPVMYGIMHGWDELVEQRKAELDSDEWEGVDRRLWFFKRWRDDCRRYGISPMSCGAEQRYTRNAKFLAERLDDTVGDKSGWYQQTMLKKIDTFCGCMEVMRGKQMSVVEAKHTFVKKGLGIGDVNFLAVLPMAVMTGLLLGANRMLATEGFISKTNSYGKKLIQRGITSEVDLYNLTKDVASAFEDGRYEACEIESMTCELDRFAENRKVYDIYFEGMDLTTLRRVVETGKNGRLQERLQVIRKDWMADEWVEVNEFP